MLLLLCVMYETGILIYLIVIIQALVRFDLSLNKSVCLKEKKNCVFFLHQK